MTISATTRKAGPFSGNGVQTSFPFTFKVFAAADVLVVQTNAAGVETTKTLTTDYTVSLNADQNANPGGSVVMGVAPPTGYLLTLGSQVALAQGLQLTNAGNFNPAVINDALDKLTVITQQLQEKLNRAVTTDFSSTTDPAALVAQVVTAAATATAAVATMVTSGASSIGFLQSGTGAVSRSVQDRLRERISVKDFGVKGAGDGVDETTKVQAAINEAMAQTGTAADQPHVSVWIPPGCDITVSGLSATKHIQIEGAGSSTSRLRLAAGVTAALFTLYAEDIAGTSIDDIISFVVRGLGLLGNRVDSVTTNSSHAVYCPDTAWSITTQYSPSVKMDDVQASGFTGSGLWTGANRNAAELVDCWLRYNNREGWSTYSYDSTAMRCKFGVNSSYGVRGYAGGNNKLIGNTIFMNLLGVVLDSFTNSSWKIADNDIDDNKTGGVYMTGSGTADSHLIEGNTFWNNSTTTTNTYSDIKVDGIEDVIIAGNHFKYGGVNQVKYLLEEIGSSSRVRWGDNTVPSTGTAPYGTAVSNMFTQDPGLLMSAVQVIGWQDAAGAMKATISSGTGAPGGAVSANPGSIYFNLSGGAGTTMYVKESGTGTAGWIAK